MMAATPRLAAVWLLGSSATLQMARAACAWAEPSPLRSSSTSASTPPTSTMSARRPSSDMHASTAADCSRITISLERCSLSTQAQTTLGSEATALLVSASSAK